MNILKMYGLSNRDVLELMELPIDPSTGLIEKLESITKKEAKAITYDMRYQLFQKKVAKYTRGKNETVVVGREKVQGSLPIPRIIVNALKRYVSPKAKLDWELLESYGVEELMRQLQRFYNIDIKNKTIMKGKGEDIFCKFYDPKKGDITVGPFFLKGLKHMSPFPQSKDTGCIRYLKGRILDGLRAMDPATRQERAMLKKIDAYINEYQQLTKTTPTYNQICEYFKISSEELDSLLTIDIAEKSAMEYQDGISSGTDDDSIWDLANW